jgi:hypothetical protein
MVFFADSSAFFPAIFSEGTGSFCSLEGAITADKEQNEELWLLSKGVPITNCPIYNLFCKKLLMLYNALIIGQDS